MRVVPAATAALAVLAAAAVALPADVAELDVRDEAEPGHAGSDADNTLPVYFPDARACPRSEPSRVLNDCIATNLRAMIPHINEGNRVGLPSLEPYFVPEVKVDYHSYIADFHAIVSKMSVTGLSTISVLGARTNLKDDTMDLEVDVFIPKMTYSGHFEFTNGFFSSLWHFKGKGPFDITFRNISAAWRLYGRKEPGSEFMTIVKGIPKYAVGGMKFWAKDLVEGYPFLDDIIINVVNRLWVDVVKFGKPAVQKEFSEQLRKLSNTVFQQIPYDSIFPPA